MANQPKGFIPGVIGFLGLVIFFGGILWLSGKNILFSPDYRLYFEFSDVVGMRDQAPVYLRGYRIGWTKKVELKGEMVRIGADINRHFQIPEDSDVAITTFNFLGEKAITIQPGKSQRFLEHGAVVSGVNKDLMTMASSILTTAQARIEGGDLDQVIQKATGSIDSLLQLVRNLDAKVGQIDVSLYNRRVNDFGAAAAEIKTFVEQAGRDTHQFTVDSRASMERFEATLANVDTALQQLTQLSAEIKLVTEAINSSEGTIGELVQNKEFLDRLNRTINELNAFLADIKKNPKKYVRFSIF